MLIVVVDGITCARSLFFWQIFFRQQISWRSFAHSRIAILRSVIGASHLTLSLSLWPTDRLFDRLTDGLFDRLFNRITDRLAAVPITPTSRTIISTALIITQSSDPVFCFSFCPFVCVCVCVFVLLLLEAIHSGRLTMRDANALRMRFE